MADNKIQIKRSTANAVVTGLSNGELAFTQASNTLWIGLPDGSGAAAIAGVRNPGVLTANQALVANATGYINTVKTANLVVGSIAANGTVGSDGSILFSNGTAAYWGAAATGSVSSVDSGDGLTGGPITSSGTLSVKANNGIVANSSGLFVKQGTGVVVNSSGVSVNSAYIGTLAANSATYLNGNTASDLRSYSDSAASSAAATAYSNATSYADTKAATAYSNATSYADTKAATAYSNATSYADTKAATAYSNAMSDTLSRDGTYTGNNSFQGNKTTFTNNVIIGTDRSDIISLNGSVNTSIIPSANVTYDLGSSTMRWKDLYLSGSTLVLGTTTVSDNSGALSSANITATAVLKSQDLNVLGNTTLGDSSSDVVSFTARVNTSILPSANVTYDLGTNTLRWNEIHASNVHSTTGYFEGRVEIGGDLFVTGNVTTTNVNSVVVSDPIIYLAGNNYSSDLVDIGFAGNYNDGVTDRHTGLIRHAATDQYYLFKNTTQELSGNNVVDINNASFKLSDLNAYLVSGGLISNAGSVAITANSTVNVAIVANTLSLSTALPANSGGTGQSSYATGDLLYASSSSALSKLSVAANGYILQIVNNMPAYDTLDGGTF